MSRKLLHTHAALNGVNLVYVCRFISADLEKPGAGRVLWRCPDYAEAKLLWQATIGEPYDQGKFTLSAEAIYEETPSVPRPRKPDNQLDFWRESENGVSAELPDAPSGGPSDQSAPAAQGADGRGDNRVAGVDHDLAP